jgi:hypothetical protein
MGHLRHDLIFEVPRENQYIVGLCLLHFLHLYVRARQEFPLFVGVHCVASFTTLESGFRLASNVTFEFESKWHVPGSYHGLTKPNGDSIARIKRFHKTINGGIGLLNSNR